MKPAPFLLLMITGLVIVDAPTLRAQSFLDQLEQQLDGQPQTPSTPQQAQPATKTPGYLGLFADDSDPLLPGVRVNEVVAGSPAAKSGIQAGDTITAVDGRRISRLNEMVAGMQRKGAGANVRFQVVRGGVSNEITVTLGERNSTRKPAADPNADQASTNETPQNALPTPTADSEEIPEALPVTPNDAQADPSRRPSLGVAVTDVTTADQIRYGLRVRNGAIVRTMKENSPAKRSGVRVGSLIVAANGRGIRGSRDLVTIMQGLTPDDSIDLSFYTGNRLYTKTISLSDAVTVNRLPPRPGTNRDAVQPRPTDPSLQLVPPGEDRPILKGLERAINGIVKQGRDAATIEDENTALRQEVEAMRKELSAMRARMQELEKKLVAPNPSEPTPAVPVEDAPLEN